MKSSVNFLRKSLWIKTLIGTGVNLGTKSVSWGGAQLEPEYLRAFQRYEVTDRNLPKGSPTSFIIDAKEYLKTKEDVIKLLRRRFVQ